MVRIRFTGDISVGSDGSGGNSNGGGAVHGHTAASGDAAAAALEAKVRGVVDRVHVVVVDT
jgi:hypothetical protein